MLDTIQHILFRMMPATEHMVSYDDRLLLYDNLQIPLEKVLNAEIRSFMEDLPKKIRFTIVIACVDGILRIRCHLMNYTLQKGSFFVMAPYTIIERIDITPNSRLIVFVLSDDSYAPSALSYETAYSRIRFVRPLHIVLCPDLFSEVVAIYGHLKYCLQRFRDAASNDLVKSYMQVLSGLIAIGIREQQTSQRPQLSNGEKILQNFLEHVAADYAYYRDIAHYAEKACLSPKYFAKVIYATSGRHPADWIRDYVILEAKTMLRSGFSIQQVCDALNFQTQSHFGRYFKAAVGISPKQYALINRL